MKYGQPPQTAAPYRHPRGSSGTGHSCSAKGTLRLHHLFCRRYHSFFQPAVNRYYECCARRRAATAAQRFFIRQIHHWECLRWYICCRFSSAVAQAGVSITHRVTAGFTGCSLCQRRCSTIIDGILSLRWSAAVLSLRANRRRRDTIIVRVGIRVRDAAKARNTVRRRRRRHYAAGSSSSSGSADLGIHDSAIKLPTTSPMLGTNRRYVEPLVVPSVSSDGRSRVIVVSVIYPFFRGIDSAAPSSSPAQPAHGDQLFLLQHVSRDSVFSDDKLSDRDRSRIGPVSSIITNAYRTAAGTRKSRGRHRYSSAPALPPLAMLRSIAGYSPPVEEETARTSHSSLEDRVAPAKLDTDHDRRQPDQPRSLTGCQRFGCELRYRWYCGRCRSLQQRTSMRRMPVCAWWWGL